MNYFELYNIPVSLKPDAQTIKNKFYELSRKYHPDFFTNEGEDAQQYALEQSALINKAFAIFNNESETIKYVLQLNNLIEEEEKYTLSPNFLMDVMELNEQLLDAKMEGDTTTIENITTQIHNLQSAIYEPIKSIVENYQEGNTTQEELLQVKEYYFRKKYLTRILAGLS
ncbi:MAG: hypothetical protein KF781_04335 [Chitinophagaceae bacterium]|nr:hypothetical protein [Chitinophagaceae bacterium]MCW5904688.1 hypothetical protein [Chitinophagaceae bacterium]